MNRKAFIEIELLPWQTPNYVIAKMPPRPRQEGIHEPPKWLLAEVDADMLSNLCTAFRAEIFRKAGKPDPLVQGRDPSTEQAE